MSEQTPRFGPFPGTDAECFIQWKGTNVCIDVFCACEPDDPKHFDGYFAYHLRCPKCGAVYELGSQVRLRRLGPDEPLDPPILQELKP